MKTRARWLATLLAGLGVGGPVVADDPVPVRQYVTSGPYGSRRRVVEILPATELAAPPAELPPAAGVVDVPATRDTELMAVVPAWAAGPSVWAEVDYIQWWYRGGPVQPVITTGSSSDLTPGALGQPNTRILYGGGKTEPEWAGGGRVRLGGFAAGTPFGWEAGGFHTLPQATTGSFSSGDFPVLGRPFYDTILNGEAVFLFGFPGAFDGLLTTQTRTTFWGLEANATADLGGAGTNTGFIGFRYLQMTDDLSISGRYAVGPNGLGFINGVNLLPGATAMLTDRVYARNEFYGGQAGWKHHSEVGRFGIDLRGSLAVGGGRQRVIVQGSTSTVDADGTRRDAQAGLLAQPSSSGQYDRGRMSVVPEVGARVSLELLPGVRLHAGYDFLYWAFVARAGDQLDHVVDSRQSPTSTNFLGGAGFRPLTPFRDTAFWAHGVNVGVSVQY